MTDKVGKSICGDGQGARSDGNVWVIDVNDVEEERQRENRTAAAALRLVPRLTIGRGNSKRLAIPYV